MDGGAGVAQAEDGRHREMRDARLSFRRAPGGAAGGAADARRTGGSGPLVRRVPSRRPRDIGTQRRQLHSSAHLAMPRRRHGEGGWSCDWGSGSGVGCSGGCRPRLFRISSFTGRAFLREAENFWRAACSSLPACLPSPFPLRRRHNLDRWRRRRLPGVIKTHIPALPEDVDLSRLLVLENNIAATW